MTLHQGGEALRDSAVGWGRAPLRGSLQHCILTAENKSVLKLENRFTLQLKPLSLRARECEHIFVFMGRIYGLLACVHQ